MRHEPSRSPPSRAGAVNVTGQVVSDPGLPPLANFIAGQWREGRDPSTFVKRNPAQPDQVLAEVPQSEATDVASATEAAQSGAEDWANLRGPERGAVLYKVARRLELQAEVLARSVTRDSGKPISEARGEVQRAISILRYFGGEGWRPTGERFDQSSGGLIYTLRRPIGVVALITPWNFPLAIPVWKLAPALAYGNTVVLKLASDASITGLHLARLFEESGAPAGILNVLNGSGSVLGPELIRRPEVRGISFTGSESVGQGVRTTASEQAVRSQLELGGHSPAIVMADADIDAAVEGVFRGAYFSQGQKCTATRRVYVESAIYERFRERLVDRIEKAKVGHPENDDTEVGPLVNERQMNLVLEAIDRTVDQGGRLLAGGRREERFGYLVQPTLFEGLSDDAYLSCEEVFGPVAALYRVEDLTEAIDRANRVRLGLSAALYSQNLESARRFAGQLAAGVLHVNSPTAGAEPHVPFGGLKGSGWGPHEQGRAAIEFYTDLVTVYEDV